MWQGIQGHDAVVEQFRRSLAAGRLASTFLFVGPEGVGKRTFAIALAKSLLCTEADEAHLAPCGACPSCRLCNSGSHPDLHVVGRRPGAKHLQIDQFIGERDHRHRDGLCHDLSLRPLVGRRRVAVIDDSDWLNQESANCLLKMLEEPPPGSVVILIGTSRGRQLPTILSRAQLVRFSALDKRIVRDLALAHGIATDGATALTLAERSGGSLAKARDSADAELWIMRDRIVTAWQAERFDATQLVRDVEDLVAAAGKESDVRRQRLRQLLTMVGDRLRESLREGERGEASDRTLAALDRGLEAEEQLDRNANQATLVEAWLDELSSLARG